MILFSRYGCGPKFVGIFSGYMLLLVIYFFAPPPRWGGMVLATSKKTRDRELPLETSYFFVVTSYFWYF